MTWREQPNGRSISCNGGLIKHFRQERKWTQEELAARAGFGVRVVAKAEAGDTVAPGTVEVLAETLSQEGDRVWPDDLVSDPLFLARRFFRHYSEEQENVGEACSDFLSPKLLTIVNGVVDGNPIAGEYLGPEGFTEFFQTFFSLFERTLGRQVLAPSMQVDGATVVAWGHEDIRLKGVPNPSIVNNVPYTPGLFVIRMSFVAGLMVRFEDYYDESGMMMRINENRDVVDQILRRLG